MSNKQTIIDATILGVPQTRIAARVGCSVRTVRRIQRDAGIYQRDQVRLNSETERNLMQHLSDTGEGMSRIGQRFGISRQAVYQQLNQ